MDKIMLSVITPQDTYTRLIKTERDAYDVVIQLCKAFRELNFGRWYSWHIGYGGVYHLDVNLTKCLCAQIK